MNLLNSNFQVRNELAKAILRIEELKQENETLKKTNSKVRQERNSFKFVLNKCKRRLDAFKTNPPKAMRDKIGKEILGPYFTEAQIKCFLRGNWSRVRTWDQDDFSLALTLRLLSPRAYKFLRKRKIVPLPGTVCSFCPRARSACRT
jgi:hypothetical protein